MCKKPRVLGLSGTSPASVAGRVGVVLIRLGPATLNGRSAAARGAAAVFALVAGAVGDHEHAALGAGWSAFVGVGLFGGGRRIAGGNGRKQGVHARGVRRSGSG